MARSRDMKPGRAAAVKKRKKAAQRSQPKLAAAAQFADLLRESEERLRLAQAGAESGAWDLNLKTNELIWSPENGRLYGIEPEAFNNRYEDWRRLVHPEDIERVDRQLREAIEQRSAYSSEFRIRHGSGAMRWISSKGKAYYDEQGEPLRMLGVTIDITERKRAEEALRESQARLAGIVETAMDAIVSVDAAQHITLFNSAAERMFGCSAAEAIGQSLDRLIPTSLREKHRQHVLEFAETGKTTRRMGELGTVTGLRANGEEFPAEASISQLEIGGQKLLTVILRDITARKRLENELEQHAKTLEEADRRKDEFIAMLAHELRNPLAPIRSAVEILGLCDSSDPDFDWGRSVIDQQVKHLARLLDDLLDLSRITGNKLELKKERLLLADVVNAALEASRPIIDQRNHNVSVTAALEPIYLHGDTVRLTQVFTNLINNAAKYTTPGGRIGVSGEKNDGAVVVRVVDNGVGISAAQLPYIFDMFYQADRSYEQAYGGLGIGLTLVKRLVEMHGGAVEAHSAGVNQGSEFIVRLPFIAEPAQATKDKTGPDLKSYVRRRILVVDDYPNAAESLARWLRRLNHEVEVAFDGLQGIEAAEKLRPEIILLDIGMPKLNGYETADRIRQQPWGKQTVLVALTGWGQAEDLQRSREAGFDLHLVKPVDYAQLAAFLAQIPSG